MLQGIQVMDSDYTQPLEKVNIGANIFLMYTAFSYDVFLHKFHHFLAIIFSFTFIRFSFILCGPKVLFPTLHHASLTLLYQR